MRKNPITQVTETEALAAVGIATLDLGTAKQDLAEAKTKKATKAATTAITYAQEALQVAQERLALVRAGADRIEALIDLCAAEVYEDLTRAEQYLKSSRDSIFRQAGASNNYGQSAWFWKATNQFAEFDEALAKVEARVAAGEGGLYNAKQALEHYAERLDIAEALRIQNRDFVALYARDPWTRFFLVRNTNGHIHSSLNCSTCRWNTQFGWLPTLSGLDEAAAVEQEGAKLCTVCYPSAPVEWTTYWADRKAARKAAKEAA